ncbi:Outer membrane protein TolC [Catalinimonas alkaloidigena]|uniref:Outer membrane protein TolC n=1 Tax=Catalinimonas alkaloidigena TaxID=1075417 RepID=A0A1G9MQ44_9BACT|nr:TolC family protein [Catalinimonas alkaloidigena]SDL76370.1 Outer membrane protein TolC [Catalinimonas alkaloidigena]
MQYIRLLSFLFLWFAATSGHAQSVLEAYLAEGLQNNRALQRQEFDYQNTLAALREARGLFFPTLSFNASYTVAQGGRTIALPVGDLLNPVYGTLNQLTDSQRFPQIQNQEVQFLPNDFHETKLRVVQPILNSDIWYNYQAKEAMAVSQQAQKQAYERQLRKEIKTAYFRYLQSEQVLRIYDDTEVLLQELLRVNERLVANQQATREVVYDAEYELTNLHSEQASATQQQQTAQAYFNFLLNRPLTDAIREDTSITAETTFIALESQKQQALQQREEIHQLQAAQQANEALVKMSKNLVLPKVNAVLDAGYQGFGYTFDHTQDFWLANFSLQWDLFKGRQNAAKLQQARIDQQKLQNQAEELQQQLQLQVTQAYYQLEAAQRKLQATASGQRSAEENFRMVRRKYVEQQVPTVQLTDARTKLTQARISHAIARYDVLIRQAELDYAAGN